MTPANQPCGTPACETADYDYEACPSCDGSGSVVSAATNDLIECRPCKGSGEDWSRPATTRLCAVHRRPQVGLGSNLMGNRKPPRGGAEDDDSFPPADCICYDTEPDPNCPVHSEQPPFTGFNIDAVGEQPASGEPACDLCHDRKWLYYRSGENGKIYKATCVKCVTISDEQIAEYERRQSHVQYHGTPKELL